MDAAVLRGSRRLLASGRHQGVSSKRNDVARRGRVNRVVEVVSIIAHNDAIYVLLLDGMDDGGCFVSNSDAIRYNMSGSRIRRGLGVVRSNAQASCIRCGRRKDWVCERSPGGGNGPVAFINLTRPAKKEMLDQEHLQHLPLLVLPQQLLLQFPKVFQGQPD